MVGERIPVEVTKIEDEYTGAVTYTKRCSACGYTTHEYPTIAQADKDINRHLKDEHAFGRITTHRATAREVQRVVDKIPFHPTQLGMVGEMQPNLAFNGMGFPSAMDMGGNMSKLLDNYRPDVNDFVRNFGFGNTDTGRKKKSSKKQSMFDNYSDLLG